MGERARHVRPRGGGLGRLRDHRRATWGPAWHLDSVVYEIFPDRFAAAGPRDRPARLGRADAAGTSCRPAAAARRRSSSTAATCAGVEQHLDHIESLGANLIYLTPFFPASSTHRYDATSFAHVDPLLGGDAALESRSRAAAHARGIRLLGDHHAQPHRLRARVVPGRAGRPERARARVLLLRRVPPQRLRVVARPSVRCRSSTGRARSCTSGSARCCAATSSSASTAGGSTSPNMVGPLPRPRSEPRRVEVDARAGRRRPPDRRARARLPARPRRARLARRHELLRLPAPALDVAAARRSRARAAGAVLGHTGVGVPQLDGEQSVAALQRFRAGVPWESVLHSWNLLDSHDTARFRTIAGTGGPPPRRRRPADVAARRADALRRRRARARRRLGRGRAPHDAVGRRRVVGHRLPRADSRARRACAARAVRSRAAASATCTCRPTQSPSCARPATSSCSCSPSRATHEPIDDSVPRPRNPVRRRRLERRPACRRSRVPHLEGL